MKLSMFISLEKEFEEFRNKIEPFFQPETASGEFNNSIPSTGHCAVVAAIIYSLYGGEMVSAIVDGVSHWFNRITIDQYIMDIDLTGDQFGEDKVQIMFSGDLYPNTKVRQYSELNKETLRRIGLFAGRAGIEHENI